MGVMRTISDYFKQFAGEVSGNPALYEEGRRGAGESAREEGGQAVPMEPRIVALTPDAGSQEARREESIRADAGSIAAGVFYHRRPPQFAFTSGEQQLLEVALEGFVDEEAAKSLFVSVPAIKRRWANIFERVAAVKPDLCPPNTDSIRGVQKRQRVLA